MMNMILFKINRKLFTALKWGGGQHVEYKGTSYEDFKKGELPNSNGIYTGSNTCGKYITVGDSATSDKWKSNCCGWILHQWFWKHKHHHLQLPSTVNWRKLCIAESVNNGTGKYFTGCGLFGSGLKIYTGTSIKGVAVC